MNDIVKGQPLTLPDGTVILPETRDDGKRVLTKDQIQDEQLAAEVEQELEEIISHPFDNAHSVSYKRTLADVDLDFQQMNVFMLVTAYTMWGLDTFAISHLLKVDPDKVERILSSPRITELRNDIIEAIRYAETASVHGYLASQALPAAKVVASSLKATSADTRLAAAKDLLDRTGFRPTDRVEHTHKFEDELRVVYIEDTGKLPKIDLSLEK